jgi:hypothetical protein
LFVSITTFPACASTGMSFTNLSGTATTTKSPAAAAPRAVDALADGPSSVTSLLNVTGPLELAITTLWPLAIAARDMAADFARADDADR